MKWPAPRPSSGRAGGIASAKACPENLADEASVTVFPPICSAFSAINACIRARDRSGSAAASARSSRPAPNIPSWVVDSPSIAYTWVMEVRISSDQRQQLLDWAAEAAPEECCGLLFGENGVIAGMELVANVAADPTQTFEIDPKSLIAAEKSARGGERPIAGYFHSHPGGDCSPSATDAAQAAPDGRIWLIIAQGRNGGMAGGREW